MTTDTMTDRERIAQVIWEASGHPPGIFRPLHEIPHRTQEAIYATADAVLAALDGRLLPELPELPERVYSVDAHRQGGIWHSAVHYDSPDPEPRKVVSGGTGPTIAAAVRGALRREVEQ